MKLLDKDNKNIKPKRLSFIGRAIQPKQLFLHHELYSTLFSVKEREKKKRVAVSAMGYYIIAR